MFFQTNVTRMEKQNLGLLMQMVITHQDDIIRRLPAPRQAVVVKPGPSSVATKPRMAEIQLPQRKPFQVPRQVYTPPAPARKNKRFFPGMMSLAFKGAILAVAVTYTLHEIKKSGELFCTYDIKGNDVNIRTGPGVRFFSTGKRQNGYAVRVKDFVLGASGDNHRWARLGGTENDLYVRDDLLILRERAKLCLP